MAERRDDVQVLEIHRYPVKSMLGERLETVAVDERGLVGDRMWAVRDGRGKFASGKNGRRFHRMDPAFECSATLDATDVPLVSLPDGTSLPAFDPRSNAALTALMGTEVRLVREGETLAPQVGVVPHFDAGSVSLVGTATLNALGETLGDGGPVDPRRFRVNFVIETQEPYVEDGWIGRTLAIGDLRLYVTEPIERCRTVDIRQGEVPPHGRVLKTLGAQRQLMLAMYADPVQVGTATVTVGDPVTLR